MLGHPLQIAPHLIYSTVRVVMLDYCNVVQTKFYHNIYCQGYKFENLIINFLNNGTNEGS